MSQRRFVYAVRLFRPYVRARLVPREVPLINLLPGEDQTFYNNLLTGEDSTFPQMFLYTQHSIDCGYTHHNHSQESYLAKQ